MRKNYNLDSLSDLDSLVPDETFSRASEPASRTEWRQAQRSGSGLVSTLLVEQNTLLREGLKRILAETPFGIVASAPSLDEALRQWTPDDKAFLLIMSAGSDHDEICRQIRQLKAERPFAKSIVLVDQYDLKEVISAFQAGADAYLVKSVSCEVLVKSLDLVMLGETVFPAAILKLVREQAAETEKCQAAPEDEASDAAGKLGKRGLSVRETVILRCLMQGDSNKLIARKFDITEATVKVHVKAILRKIRAKNRTQAAIWAASHLRPSEQMSASEG
ncbi:LuxR C-terminal-related transcriptional regulator [Microvirga sp. 2TAF3]|uniref:LuxR C-terminal-related transcriptional regulator n=1 Tax=Microvirga sp. 2TAF3 TaxID=3233014 RepID=UPI003F9E65EE